MSLKEYKEDPMRLVEQRPPIADDRRKYIYYPGAQVVPVDAAPHLCNVAHSVSVHANVPKGGAEGVLLSMGGVDGGFSFYIKNRKLVYGYNYVADRHFKVQSNGGGGVPEGDHIFGFEFTPTDRAGARQGRGVPAKIKLFVDGDEIGAGDLPVTIPLSLGLSTGVSVGVDSGAPTTDTEYTAPFPFTGTVKKALLDLTGDASEDQVT